MYALYADESGFSKANKYETEQPVLVVAGILIDFSKLTKAISVFDEILLEVNAKLSRPVPELRFSEIRNKEPFRTSLPEVEERANLLEYVLIKFQEEIDFKIFYCAIDNETYYKYKRTEPILRNNLKHPYLCAAYKVLSQMELCQIPKKKNKGKTFVVFDEQNQFQGQIEALIQQPLHLPRFAQIFDSAYFGKSHYSKIIQIADLIAGTIRYFLSDKKEGILLTQTIGCSELTKFFKNWDRIFCAVPVFPVNLKPYMPKSNSTLKNKPRRKVDEAKSEEPEGFEPPTAVSGFSQ